MKKITENIIQELSLPEFHLILGGLPGNQTPADSFNPVADGIVARRFSSTEKCLVTDNNEWQYGKIYNAWAPNITSNYYVLNPQNLIVYLCTDNKVDNREDYDPAISTEIPSHTTPTIETYTDGYSWIPLFKVDISQLEFLNSRDLPIPDLNSKDAFTTLASKYYSLCGVTGVTSFGCCCLYFKENAVDEITGEVYNSGDLTNETIFSDCFECQKLAENLDRDVLFLRGITANGVTGSGFSQENPLCPSTKTIQTLLETLNEQRYILPSGSSKEYALYLLNNFTNNKGIMSARIDLTGVTDGQKNISTTNPDLYLTIKDRTGSGASIKMITEQVDGNTYKINGVDLISSGSGYTEVTDWELAGTTLDDNIKLVYFPDNFYNNPTSLVPPKRYSLKCQITSDELQTITLTESLTKIAVLQDPKFVATDATAVFADGDKSLRHLQTTVTVVTGPELEIL